VPVYRKTGIRGVGVGVVGWVVRPAIEFPRGLKPGRDADDKTTVEIKEDLIQEALLKSNAGDLDAVLTAIEAYRICARTAGKLSRSRVFSPQRNEVTACAEYCESVLMDYAATGRLKQFHYPDRDFGCAHLNLEVW